MPGVSSRIRFCITKGEVHRIPDALWTLVGDERGGRDRDGLITGEARSAMAAAM